MPPPCGFVKGNLTFNLKPKSEAGLDVNHPQ
jgi:hypothetical protein